MDALTLGGRQSLDIYSAQTVQDVKDFWNIFIGEEAMDCLAQDGRARAGPGFYFTVKAGKPTTPKVYISPASFCENDAEVVRRLRRYFETRKYGGDGERELMMRQMESYEKALEEI